MSNYSKIVLPVRRKKVLLRNIPVGFSLCGLLKIAVAAEMFDYLVDHYDKQSFIWKRIFRFITNTVSEMPCRLQVENLVLTTQKCNKNYTSVKNYAAKKQASNIFMTAKLYLIVSQVETNLISSSSG